MGRCAHYEPDVFVWMPNTTARSPGWTRSVPELHLQEQAVRAYYYTSFRGDSVGQEALREQIWSHGFQPEIFKRQGDRKAKGVDIALSKDLLSHAFMDNYQTAVLYAGDGDYAPLLREIKRVGRRVCVAFFGPDHGLSSDLRLEADFYFDITSTFVSHWRQWCEQSKAST